MKLRAKNAKPENNNREFNQTRCAREAVTVGDAASAYHPRGRSTSESTKARTPTSNFRVSIIFAKPTASLRPSRANNDKPPCTVITLAPKRRAVYAGQGPQKI